MPGFHFENRFSAKDDAKIIYLKEQRNLPWADIANFFEGRSKGSLQVRYSRTLKPRKREPEAIYNPTGYSSEDEPTTPSDDQETDEATTEGADIEMSGMDNLEDSEADKSDESDKSANGMQQDNETLHQRENDVNLEYTSSDDNLTDIDEETIAETTSAYPNVAHPADHKEVGSETPSMPPYSRKTRQTTGTKFGKVPFSPGADDDSDQPAEGEELVFKKGWEVVDADFMASWAEANPTSRVPKAFLDPSPKRQLEFNYESRSFRTRTRQEFLPDRTEGPSQVIFTRPPTQRTSSVTKRIQKKPSSKSVQKVIQKANLKLNNNASRKVTTAPVHRGDDYVSDTDEASNTTLKRGLKIVPSCIAPRPQRNSSVIAFDQHGNVRRPNLGLWAGEQAAGVIVPNPDDTESDNSTS